MSLTDEDLKDYRLSRPAAVTDIFDLRDLIERLEALEENLKAREDRLIAAILALEKLYNKERVKTWELYLQEMLRQEMAKQQRQKDRTNGNSQGPTGGNHQC